MALLTLTCLAGIVNASFYQLVNMFESQRFGGDRAQVTQGSDPMFDGIEFLSESYFLTFWVYESVAKSDVTYIRLSLPGTSQGQFGYASPLVRKLDGNSIPKIQACVDTQSGGTTTSVCATTQQLDPNDHTWMFVYASVCKDDLTIEICHRGWRQTSQGCRSETFVGEIASFSKKGQIEIGGLNANQSVGLNGKIVDMRYYPYECKYQSIAGFSLQFSQRCERLCADSCNGPDQWSCEGIQLSDRYQSTNLELVTTPNAGVVEYQTDDVALQGFPIDSREMSVSMWIYITNEWNGLTNGTKPLFCLYMLKAADPSVVESKVMQISFNDSRRIEFNSSITENGSPTSITLVHGQQLEYETWYFIGYTIS